jgi:hypothetical protein
MSLFERTTVHAEEFSIERFEPLYARRGLGPHVKGNYAIPQRSSCVVRRLLTQMYFLNRIDPTSSRVRSPLIWPVKAPGRIAIVELRDEDICFRMRNLAFFEEGLRLSTIVNAQVPWLAFESPLITRISGTGRVGIRIDGQADCFASTPTHSPPHINLLRLAAWSCDTRLGFDVERGYSNTVLVAPATAIVHSSSLVIAGRDDNEGIGTAGLLMRIGRLIVP